MTRGCNAYFHQFIHGLGARIAVQHGAKRKVAGQFGEVDAAGFDCVERHADGGRVEANFADYTSFGQQVDCWEVAGWRRCYVQADYVWGLLILPLCTFSPIDVSECQVLMKLTSQFCAMKLFSPTFHEKDVQPSLNMPYAISVRTFSTRMSSKSTLAPSATPRISSTSGIHSGCWRLGRNLTASRRT